MDEKCNFCPRQCSAVRTPQSGNGFCRMPSVALISRASLHKGEEPCISGDADCSGSGTIFFSGCTLRCHFCQNRQISRSPVGKAVSAERLAAIFQELERQGAVNINLVNPTHYVAVIREALSLYRPSVPIVYNTSGYERVETLGLLEGLVDVYLPDLKYISADLSLALSGASDYAQYACPAILEMARQTGPVVLDERGLAVRGTVVRHLVLPGHTKESMKVIDWLAAHLPRGTYVSLMFQYTPMVAVDGYPELSRRLTARECDKVWNYLIEAGLTDGYVQQRDSAGEEMIPLFDGSGV